MRQAIESAPRDQEDIILEDDVSGTFDVAHWSPEAGKWIRENGEPSKIAPTHWYPIPANPYVEKSSTSSHTGRTRRRVAAFSIIAAVSLAVLYFRAEAPLRVARSPGQQDTIGTGAQAETRKPPEVKQAEARSATDQSGPQLQSPAATAAQSLEEERQKTAALALGSTPARQDQPPSPEQQRQGLQDDRARAAALARELAVARREIEADAAQLNKAREEAAQFKLTAERTSAELQKERENAETLSHELATARREIEANAARLITARDDAAKFRQTAETTTAELQQERDRARALSHELAMAQRAMEARAAIEPAPNGLVTQASLATGTTAPVQPTAADAQSNPEAARLMARASALLAQGNIGSARIVLERAADTGSPQASFMLAETYDPVILSSWGTYGTRGEATKARELYARAHAGGIQEARKRFDALSQ
jgi:hypothetical protein